LPKIDVPILDRPQPRILELLVAPERGERVDAVCQGVAAAPRSGGKVKQRAIMYGPAVRRKAER